MGYYSDVKEYSSDSEQMEKKQRKKKRKIETVLSRQQRKITKIG